MNPSGFIYFSSVPSESKLKYIRSIKNISESTPLFAKQRGDGGEFMITGDYDLTSFGRDPIWSILQSQIAPLLVALVRSFYFHLSSHRQAWFGHLKIKIPQKAAGAICLCGERGIRTPGSPDGEQRFSRPPHSTTLPSLLKLFSQIHKIRFLGPATEDH